MKSTSTAAVLTGGNIKTNINFTIKRVAITFRHCFLFFPQILQDGLKFKYHEHHYTDRYIQTLIHMVGIWTDKWNGRTHIQKDNRIRL